MQILVAFGAGENLIRSLLNYNKSTTNPQQIESCIPLQQIRNISTCQDVVELLYNKWNRCSLGFDLLGICCSVAANQRALIDHVANDVTAWRVFVCELHTTRFIASACIHTQ